MLFLFGWGKNAKIIAYLGIIKCGHCKNYSHFHLYETYNNIKLYFVPVAKFNKKYIMACDTCQAGIELNENQRLKILQESINIPPKEEYIKLWNIIDNQLCEVLSNMIDDFKDNNLQGNLSNLSEEQQKLMAKLQSKYDKKILEVVDKTYQTTNYDRNVIVRIVETLGKLAFDRDTPK